MKMEVDIVVLSTIISETDKARFITKMEVFIKDNGKITPCQGSESSSMIVES